MKRLDRRKGFLSIVAVLVVVVIAFLTVTATHQFAQGSLGHQNHLRSAQSFYIGQAGIEKAKNDIITNGAPCSGYDSGVITFTAPGGGTGQYRVTGVTTFASSILNGDITAASTTIPLVASSGFSATRGAVTIGNEILSYASINGNNLINATRGINGTTASAHHAGLNVSQVQCTLTSTASIPTLSNINGSRILKAVLVSTDTDFGFNVNGDPNNANPTNPSVVSADDVNINDDAKIKNLEVTTSSPNYPGANILTTDDIDIDDDAQTQVNNGSGAPLTRSTSSSLRPDVRANTTLFTTAATLWSHYFTETQAVVRSHANEYSNAGALNGLQGKVIWYNGNLNLGNVTIGTANNPVIMIVNGNLIMGNNDDDDDDDDDDHDGHHNHHHDNDDDDNYGNSYCHGHGGDNDRGSDYNGRHHHSDGDDDEGNDDNAAPTIYGFVYVIGTTTMNGNARILGSLASQGRVTMNGHSLVSYDPYLVSYAALLSGDTRVRYSKNAIMLQENFQ